eukprot:scaffold328850_cov33-Prasinocladus_malaysianus.AAC.1
MAFMSSMLSAAACCSRSRHAVSRRPLKISFDVTADAERLGVERDGRPAPLLLCNINRRAQRGEDRHGGAAAKRHDVDATAPQVRPSFEPS